MKETEEWREERRERKKEEEGRRKRKEEGEVGGGRWEVEREIWRKGGGPCLHF
jgi:hypothetical protein